MSTRGPATVPQIRGRGAITRNFPGIRPVAIGKGRLQEGGTDLLRALSLAAVVLAMASSFINVIHKGNLPKLGLLLLWSHPPAC